MIMVNARLDYYGTLLKIQFNVESEILKYKYKRDNEHPSEDQFTSEASGNSADSSFSEE